MNIRENLIDINDRIKANAKGPVTLVAVSKTVTCDEVRAAMDAGQTVFGENRVQELQNKYSVIGNKATWHLIGHLQTNKVKYVVDKVDLIHSVDSTRLADEISRCCISKNIVMPCLLQVNVSKEDSKSGVYMEDVDRMVDYMLGLEGISLKGFMTMAPLDASESELHNIFSKLYKKYLDIKQEYIHNTDICMLSMGMTHDFEIALQEGANIIRVGTGIFH